MALGRADRRVNLGVLVFAALLPDFVLWLLVLLGWESVTIPANFMSTHQPAFVFPYSHGLIASLGWSVLVGAAAYRWYLRPTQAKWRVAAVVSVAVFSHWLLDALVHAPELPLAGAGSAKAGLGLWRDMPVALAVESFIALAGLYLFVSAAKLSAAKKLSLSILSLLIIAMTVVGMTVAAPPPSAAAMAVSSLITIIVVSVLAGWLGKPRQPVT